MNHNAAIEIKNLSFGYDQTPTLTVDAFTAERGEFIRIFGPNGGGKTTFLKLLLGFLKPQRGSIAILGRAPKAVRNKIGYVPQANRFDRKFPISTIEVVLMGCLSSLSWFGTYPKQIKHRAEHALERVGLSHKRNQPFGTLSGGEAQRALIARAIISSPELLLLDEPTASIDPKAEQEIYRILFSLKREMTILMVTHDLQTIEDEADRLVCIQRHLSVLSSNELCDHYALGLYHTPVLTP